MTLITGIFILLLQWTNPMAPPPPPVPGSMDVSSAVLMSEESNFALGAEECDFLEFLKDRKCNDAFDKDRCKELKKWAREAYKDQCKHNVPLPLYLELLLFISAVVLLLKMYGVNGFLSTAKRG